MLSFNLYRRKLNVVVGTQRLGRFGVKHEVEKVIEHENFNPETLANDVGLVKLVQPIIFNENSQLIKLPTSDHKMNSSFGIIAGWGNILVSTQTTNYYHTDQLFIQHSGKWEICSTANLALLGDGNNGFNGLS